MRKDGRTLLTLEERLKLAAGSQAVSPEIAAKLVQRFSRIHTAYFFGEKADLSMSISGYRQRLYEALRLLEITFEPFPVDAAPKRRSTL